jgi:quercetin dioxygenase-like cupin family protein
MASWTPVVIALLAESIATKKSVATMQSPPLLPMRRIVTAHDDQGKAVVARDSQIHTEVLPHVAVSVNIWSSDRSPADVVSSEDKGLAETGFVNNGSIFRIVDLPPRSIGALHRSISLDYIIVQQGQVVLSLENGSKTRLRAGDVVVQQATMHGWDNETDEWARFLAIMLPAVAPVVGGKEMQTDLAALFESG